MRRVLIIGSNGAGKSTLSFALAEKTGLPLIHIDQLYWQGDWQVTPREDFEAAVLREAQKPAWIIEGNNVRSLSQRLRYADTVLWLEFSPLACLLGILRRELRYRGRARPDMPSSCISRLRLSFLRYAAGFNRRHGPAIRAKLKDAPHVQVFRFTRRRQARAFLDSLK